MCGQFHYPYICYLPCSGETLIKRILKYEILQIKKQFVKPKSRSTIIELRSFPYGFGKDIFSVAWRMSMHPQAAVVAMCCWALSVQCSWPAAPAKQRAETEFAGIPANVLILNCITYTNVLGICQLISFRLLVHYTYHHLKSTNESTVILHHAACSHDTTGNDVKLLHCQ